MLASALDPLAFTRLLGEPLMAMTIPTTTTTHSTTHATTQSQTSTEMAHEQAPVGEKTSGVKSETAAEQACVKSEKVVGETEAVNEHKEPAEKVLMTMEKACEYVPSEKSLGENGDQTVGQAVGGQGDAVEKAGLQAETVSKQCTE